MPQPSRDAAIAETERLHSLARWWTQQASHIERDRRYLRWLLYSSLPLALGLWWLWGWRIGLGGLAVTWLACAQGTYLVTVHRWEYADNLRETRRELWLARKQVRLYDEVNPPPLSNTCGQVHQIDERKNVDIF